MHQSLSWQQALPRIFPQCRPQRLGNNQQLALSDEHVVIFLSGNAFLYAYCPEIQEPFLVNYIKSGKWICNTCAPLYLTLQASNAPGKTPAFLVLTKQQVNQLCQEYETFFKEYTRQIKTQSQHFLQRLCWQKLSACERIDALLKQLFLEHESIELNHSELALMVGTTRETVSRSLYKLQSQGRLLIDDHKIKKTAVLAQHRG